MRTSKLIDFFIALGEDRELAKLFQREPTAAMDAAGLSDEEKALIQRGDQQEVRAALGPAYRDISLYTAPGQAALGPGLRAEGAGATPDTNTTHSPGPPPGGDDPGPTPDTHSTHSPGPPPGGDDPGPTPDTHSTHSPGPPPGGGDPGPTPDTHSNNHPGEPHDLRDDE
jgi:hypothetical protein